MEKMASLRDNKQRTAVRKLLQKQINEKATIKRVYEDAGLEWGEVNPDGSAEAVWDAVLEKAENKGPEALHDLLEAALEFAPVLVREPIFTELSVAPNGLENIWQGLVDGLARGLKMPSAFKSLCDLARLSQVQRIHLTALQKAGAAQGAQVAARRLLLWVGGPSPDRSTYKDFFDDLTAHFGGKSSSPPTASAPTPPGSIPGGILTKAGWSSLATSTATTLGSILQALRDQLFTKLPTPRSTDIHPGTIKAPSSSDELPAFAASIATLWTQSDRMPVSGSLDTSVRAGLDAAAGLMDSPESWAILQECGLNGTILLAHLFHRLPPSARIRAMQHFLTDPCEASRQALPHAPQDEDGWELPVRTLLLALIGGSSKPFLNWLPTWVQQEGLRPQPVKNGLFFPWKAGELYGVWALFEASTQAPGGTSVQLWLPTIQSNPRNEDGLAPQDGMLILREGNNSVLQYFQLTQGGGSMPRRVEAVDEPHLQ